MPKTVRFRRLGGPEVLEVEDLPAREPKAGEVRLKVEAIGLNRAECLFREGKYTYAPDLPSGLGYEAAGTVEAVGPGVSAVKVGDRASVLPAFSMNDYATYAESAVVPVEALAPWPEGLSAAEAAALWVQYLTAWGGMIEHGGLKPGGTVVVTAASSGVGNCALQIAKSLGATSIATTRSRAKAQDLIDRGADHVIATGEEDLAARLREVAGEKGIDLLFDCVAGPDVETYAAVAAPGATFLLYGALSPAPTPFPLWAGFASGLSMRAYSVFGDTKDPARKERGIRYVVDGLKTGALKPAIDKTFPLDQAAEAHRYLDSGRHNGKVILTV